MLQHDAGNNIFFPIEVSGFLNPITPNPTHFPTSAMLTMLTADLLFLSEPVGFASTYHHLGLLLKRQIS